MYKSFGDDRKVSLGVYADGPLTFLKKSAESKGSHKLVPVSAALKLPPLFPSPPQGSPAPLAVWPSKQKRAVRGSRAPLAVQLEAFVRNEHRLYLREHRNCTHGDTLHIVKEAFAVLIGHFVEYSGILSLIQNEYEACLEEMSTEVKRLRAIHLENESDRNLHVMELVRQRESITAIISNQQAQLTASQGLVHSLRDQVGTLEETNASLNFEVSQLKKECADAIDSKKLLADAVTQEAGRSSHFMDLCQASDLEITRLGLLVNSLKENLEESDDRYRALTKKLLLGGVERGLQSVQDFEKPKEDPVPEKKVDEEKVPEPCAIDLQRRIDDLLFAYEELKQKVSSSDKEPCKLSEPATQDAPDENKSIDEMYCAVDTVTTSQLIQSWLVEEHLTERDLDAHDFLLPPGSCEDHPLGFLKLHRPVRNRHLKKNDVIKLLRRFWLDRQSQRQVPLRRYLLQWLCGETGSEKTAQEVALNLLYVCERNLDDPQCRAMLLVMQCFLPEELIITGSTIIHEIKELCKDSSVTSDDEVQNSSVVAAVRRVMPEFSYVQMLKLRFYLYRLSNGSGKVAIGNIFQEDSHFLFLLRKGFLEATEEFTLQVVEGIRDASKDGWVVRLQDVAEVIGRVDKGMGKGTLHRILAESTQMDGTDVVKAEANFTVRLQPLLVRIRTAVLLRRSGAILPEDGEKVRPVV